MNFQKKIVTKTDEFFFPGCPPLSGGLNWLSPAVRGPMLAMMSKTSGFDQFHDDGGDGDDDDEHGQSDHHHNGGLM